MADGVLAATVSALDRALKRTKARCMFIGGVAVIAHGVRRLTDDVDATVWAEGIQLDALLGALAKERIVPRIPDVVEFAEQSQVLLLRHEPTGVDVDLTLSWLPFESAALDRADAVAIGRRRVRVATPDDLIVYKTIAARERDRSDVERLLQLHAARIDLARVKRIVRQLATALERPELIDVLEALVRKARGTSSKARPQSKTTPRRRGPRSKKKTRG